MLHEWRLKITLCSPRLPLFFTFYMPSTASQYRNLIRRIRRLPFDANTVQYARTKLKSLFGPGSRKRSSKNVQGYIETFDSVLVEEKYNQIPKVLDLIFKKLEPQPLWMQNYNEMRLDEKISRIPQHHMMEEIAPDANTLKVYYDTLEKKYKYEIPWSESALREIQETGTLGFTTVGRLTDPSLTAKDELCLPSVMSKETLDSTMKRFLENYNFVYKNQLHLTHLKLQPLELLYPISQFGDPLPLNRIRKLQREYLSKAANTIFETIRPIRKECLSILFDFVVKVDKEVNPAFFRLLKRQREASRVTQSPLIRKYKTQRKTLPSQNSIKKLVREYVLRQYYWDPELDKFVLSPMKEFYQSDTLKIDLSEEIAGRGA